MSTIFWLASYPKSGNTWLRIFFANLKNDSGNPVSINKLTDKWASNRMLIDHWLGIESSSFNANELKKLRLKAFIEMGTESDASVWVKTHDALHEKGSCFFPPEVSRGAFYLIRNPLDVVVSYAHHDGVSVQRKIEALSNEHYTMDVQSEHISRNIPQFLGSWSSHVLSWTSTSIFSVHIIRYEDMVLRPVPTFQQATKFAGIQTSKSEIQKAITFSDFKKLKEQEEKETFREKPTHLKNFFRKGKIGSWREELTDAQAAQIIDDHREVMRKFGYLDDNDNPVY